MIIYKAQNKINGKIYIGQTVRSLDDRIRRHLKQKTGSLFSRAIKKYGIEQFAFSTIDTPESLTDLNKREIYWIQYHNSKYPNGYNMTEGGEGVSGCPRSDETKMKLYLANKGKRLTDDHKAKIGNAHRGKKPSLTARLNMRLAHEGKKLLETTKKKMSLVRSGDKNASAKLTWEQVRRIRELYKTGQYTQQELADLYCVSRGSIKPIIHNRAWIE